MRIWMVGVFGLVAATGGFSQDDWPTHGGDPGGTKHSTLDQIRRDNVHQLAPVWAWETGDEPIPAARVPFAGREIKPGDRRSARARDSRRHQYPGLHRTLDGALRVKRARDRAPEDWRGARR